MKATEGIENIARTYGRPPRPVMPPNERVHSGGILALWPGVLVGVVVMLLFWALLGCAAQLGPDRWMVSKWDICGFAGGVSLKIDGPMGIGLHLGCDSPPEVVSDLDTVLEEEVPE